VASVSPLIVIFVTVFIDLLGFGIIIPLLPFYAESFGASALTIGLLGTSFSLMQFLFSPIWGRWSDRIGRKPIILVGLMGSCLSYLVLALAGSLPLVFVARIIGGIAGANIPTAQAYIADVTTAENRARGMGMVGAAFGLGFIFGPAIGGTLSHFSPETPMWFASALCFANFIAAWALLPESRVVSESTKSLGRMEAFRHAMTKPTLVLLLALYFLVTMAFSWFEATFALFSEATFGYTAATIGFVFTFIGFILSLVQGVLVGKVVKRVGERRLIPAAIFAIAMGIGLLPFVWNVGTLLTALGILAMGMGFNSPALSSMVSRLSSADDQGGILGLASSIASLGRVVGPAIGGFLYDQYGPRTPYVTAAIMMAITSLVAFAGFQSREAHAGGDPTFAKAAGFADSAEQTAGKPRV
jgi:multidrug resistance protein